MDNLEFESNFNNNNKNFSFDKTADFIEKLNSGYKPKNNDPNSTFSNGEPINYYWSNHKYEVMNELENNPRYEVGYETAKEIVTFVINRSMYFKELFEKIKSEYERNSEVQQIYISDFTGKQQRF